MALDEKQVEEFVNWIAEEYSESINKIELDVEKNELYIKLIEEIHPKEFADTVCDALFTHVNFYSSLHIHFYAFEKDKNSAFVIPFNTDYDTLRD